MNDSFSITSNLSFHAHNVNSLPCTVIPFSRKVSGRMPLIRLPGSKEHDWEKNELGACLPGGLLLFSLPNSAVINTGFTLDSQQCKTEKAA